MMILKRLKNSSLIKKQQYPFVLFFILTLVVVCSWYRSGQLIISGEESFSIFNNRNLFLLDLLWQETGTGMLNPTYIARFPINFFVTFFRELGISLWIIQASFFFSLIFSGISGMYIFTKNLIQKNSSFQIPIAIFAALFYFFNLYTQSQIWGRFLYSGMAAWALMPILLHFWMVWTRDFKIKYILYFLVSSSLLSIAFLQPAFVFTIWFPLGAFSIFELIRSFKGKIFFKKLIFMFVGVAVWLLVNLWWMYPYLSLGSESLKTIQNNQSNFDSLVGVSKYFPISEIIVLKQNYLFNEIMYYGWYQSDWVHLITGVILLIVVLGIVHFSNRKYLMYLLTILAVGIFISKGTNPPFGYKTFNFLFDNFSFFHAFRNPYEKFGLVFLIAYSVFWGNGFTHIVTRFKSTFVRSVVGTSLFLLCCVVLSWPMWTTELFGGGVYGTRVTVPQYYEEANTYLNSKMDDGRILIVPMLPGDSVIYDWSGGTYQGIEPSIFLFDKPTISRALKVPYYEEKYYSFYNAFIQNDYNAYLEELNIKYIIVNHDIKTGFSGASSSAQVKQIIAKNEKVTFDRNIGNLSIYEYDKTPMLISADNELIDITYEKVNNTQYKVYIKNDHEQFNLIFKETYSPYWTAKINDQVQSDHTRVFGYANMWKITKNGTYMIDITLDLIK